MDSISLFLLINQRVAPKKNYLFYYFMKWRAISWTTAASIVTVIELVASKQLPQNGFLKQEQIPLQNFL
ncbi:MAG: hypothetical protein ACPGCO_00215 [Flavobacteriaceae bacterium]